MHREPDWFHKRTPTLRQGFCAIIYHLKRNVTAGVGFWPVARSDTRRPLKFRRASVTKNCRGQDATQTGLSRFAKADFEA
jgi:hypothetical protein